MTDPSQGRQDFETWLEAYVVTHPYDEESDEGFSTDDMFHSWVGGAIFAANKFFNPTLPPKILPDIFRQGIDDQ